MLLKKYSSCLYCLFTKTASKDGFNSFCAFFWTILLKTNKVQVQSNAQTQCLGGLLVSLAVWPVFIDQNTFSGTLKDVVNIVINELLKYLFGVRYFPLHLESWRSIIVTPFDRVILYISCFSKPTQASVLDIACGASAWLDVSLKSGSWNKPSWSFCLGGDGNWSPVLESAKCEGCSQRYL